MPVRKHLLTYLLLFFALTVFAQPKKIIDYTTPREYTIAAINVIGATHYSHDAIRLLSELQVNQKVRIPGDDIARAIKKLWDQKLFSDVAIEASDIRGDKIFLEIIVKERPKHTGWSPKGDFRKKEFEKVKESLIGFEGQIVTENMVTQVKNITRGYYVDKGYLKARVEVNTIPDPRTNNGVLLEVTVKKGEKVKIKHIFIEGNTSLSDQKIKRMFKDTKEKKWWRFWKASKFMEITYKDDKQKIIDALNDKGLRDAKIAFDTLFYTDTSDLNIRLVVDEGHKYYIRSVTWSGNSKYRSTFLDSLVSIKRGDVYNASELDAKLIMNANGTDVTSLYMDNGYLFFSVTPVEMKVENDSIDFEFRITEGKQARVKNVIIKGNTKTNDHVIRREIRTKPGDLFSRNDIIRTQRELAQLGYFNPEKFGINPIPNPYEGTVDIEYTVEEKPSDQFQLSGGWGAGRVIGTLGLTFTNFSLRKIFKKGAWQPLPSGDGQSLSVSVQSTGQFYHGSNFSFTEPWLGGKKPNSLSISAYRTFTSRDNLKRSDPNKQYMTITGASLGFGKRLKWPDDYFSIYLELPAFQYYELHNYQGVFSFTDGYVNSLSTRFSLQRNSISDPIFPRSGSSFTFSMKLTPPYSFFNNKDYTEISDQERYKWLEYTKFKFSSQHFTKLNKSNKNPLVLMTRTGFGFLMPWNKDVGNPPFERFKLGGNGLTGFNMFFGQEIIALRGYDDGELSGQYGDMCIAKFTTELRYPLSLNPNATVYVLGFAEAGESWTRVQDFDPFRVKKSAGVGVRIFLPMFGLLGLDYGWPLDKTSKQGQFVFTIGMNLGEL